MHFIAASDQEPNKEKMVRQLRIDFEASMRHRRMEFAVEFAVAIIRAKAQAKESINYHFAREDFFSQCYDMADEVIRQGIERPIPEMPAAEDIHAKLAAMLYEHVSSKTAEEVPEWIRALEEAEKDSRSPNGGE